MGRGGSGWEGEGESSFTSTNRKGWVTEDGRGGDAQKVSDPGFPIGSPSP